MSQTDNQLIEKFSGTFEKEDSGCSILINETVNNIKNPDLLGLYCYLACRPPGWKINPKHLLKHFGCSKDKIYKMLNGLISLGLLSATVMRKQGKFVGTCYKLHTKPQTQSKIQLDEPCPDFPDTDEPCPDFPDPVNQDAYKTKKVVNKEIKEKNIKKRKSDELKTEEMATDNPHQIETETIQDWVAVRKKKKAAITRTAWKRVNKELEKIKTQLDISPQDAFETMVASGWQSLKADYFKNKRGSGQTGLVDDYEWGKNFFDDIF